MRRSAIVASVCLLVAVVAAGQGRDPVLESLRTQLEIEKRTIGLELTKLERVQDLLRDASERLMRLSNDLLRAQREGEDSGRLAERSIDLGRAEAEVNELIALGQQLRQGIAGRRTHIEQIDLEVRRLEGLAQVQGDELSGKWNVVVEPGGLRGSFDLKLDGTLLNGTYQLSGGWKGSLRGTFIGGNLRLERIDAQLGFAATYLGRLAGPEGDRRLEGSWEATNLAAGMPVSGTWVGRRDTSR
jgi:hypothetical protein